MTKTQKRELADAIVAQVNVLLDSWDEQVEEFYPKLKGMMVEEAREQVEEWLDRMLPAAPKGGGR